MLKKMLISFGFVALRLRSLRVATEYVSEWCNGYIFGSYSLADEAALALSFANNNKQFGGLIIDAGANNGSYTQSLIGSGLGSERVIMIEPAPSLRERLIALSSENSSVLFEPIAIGAQQGSLELHFDKEGSGFASVYERDLSHVGLVMDTSVTVPVTTLDQIASKYSLSVVDYLKLDLEGHELEALKGAKRLLDEKRIRAITFEFGGCNIDSKTYFKDFWTLLVKHHGFTFYRLAPQRRLIKLGRYSESLERFGWHNILACAPGVEPSWKVIH
jgi:FkbM family methyltransferase